MSEDRKEAQGRKPWLKRLAEGLMVLALAGMVIAVFVNVVLRYVFHTSIVSYEEISRLLFVWLVAIGAIVAAFEGAHLGFDMVTSRVGPATRKVLFWVSQLLIGTCMALLLWGSWGAGRCRLEQLQHRAGLSPGPGRSGDACAGHRHVAGGGARHVARHPDRVF